jgi:integrase
MKHRTGYLFKRNGTFYVQWNVNGKRFTKALRDDQGNAISTRREAEEAQTKFMATFAVADETEALESIVAKLDGRKAELARLQDEQNPPLAIAGAWTDYLAAPNRPDSGESTLRQYEFQYSAFARWMQEKYPQIITLREVTQPIAEEYAASLNHGKFTASTFNKHLNLLTLVFRVLKNKARLTGNPWEDIQRKRLTAQSRRELTVDELRNVCQSAKGELRVLLALGLYSGLRLGDCATLRWAEVDLARNIIRRIPNKTARRNPKPVIVPIHPQLREMLASPAPEQRAEYVLPEIAALYARRTDMVTDLIQAHFKTCGIKTYQPGTGPDSIGGKRAVIEVGFHSLRHTFVSLCRESNAPLAVVESIVGHSSPAMTRHYTHVGELAAGRAVAALPSIMGSPAPPVPAFNPEATLSQARATAEGITAKNWREKKAALLALLDTNSESGQTAASQPH